MTLLVPAVAGAMIVAGLLGVVWGLRPSPVATGRPRRGRTLRRWSRRARLAVGVGLVAGVVVAIASGWLIAVVVVPLAVAGLPALVSAPPAATRIERLEAMEEWTRSLSAS